MASRRSIQRQSILFKLYCDKYKDGFAMSDRSTGTICEQCKSLLVRLGDSLDLSIPCAKIIHIDVRAESICDSAARGCPICTLAEHYLRLNSRVVNHPLRVWLANELLPTGVPG
jgi:hypothetical protein